MKITIDTETNDIKLGRKSFEELDEYSKDMITTKLSNFLINNTKLSSYDVDSIWMSYRYCIGRHTIASNMRAGDIWKHAKGRMSKDRQLFTAFDINRSIEDSMHYCCGPNFWFPITSLNRIYTSAVDIFCEFLEDFDINSIEELLKYKEVHVKIYDNDRGYAFEVVTWEEYKAAEFNRLCEKHNMSYANYNDERLNLDELKKIPDFEKLYKTLDEQERRKDHFYMHDFEDLMVWNDLVHCFDNEHHHKSILTNGDEVEWFWSWTNKTEQKENGNYYRTFGYKKIRVPLNEWNGTIIKYIPDEYIKKNIY